MYRSGTGIETKALNRFKQIFNNIQPSYFVIEHGI